jgi:hypothetical protein
MLSDLRNKKETGSADTCLQNTPISNLMKNRPVVSELYYMPTEGRGERA